MFLILSPVSNKLTLKTDLKFLDDLSGPTLLVHAHYRGRDGLDKLSFISVRWINSGGLF